MYFPGHLCRSYIARVEGKVMAQGKKPQADTATAIADPSLAPSWVLIHSRSHSSFPSHKFACTPHPFTPAAADTWVVVSSDGLYNEETRGGGGGLDNNQVRCPTCASSL